MNKEIELKDFHLCLLMTEHQEPSRVVTADLLNLLKLVSQHRISQPCVDLCSNLLIRWHLKSASVEEICQVDLSQRQETVLDYRSLDDVVSDNISWVYALQRCVDGHTPCNSVNSVWVNLPFGAVLKIRKGTAWNLTQYWKQRLQVKSSNLKSAYTSKLLLQIPGLDMW